MTNVLIKVDHKDMSLSSDELEAIVSNGHRGSLRLMCKEEVTRAVLAGLDEGQRQHAANRLRSEYGVVPSGTKEKPSIPGFNSQGDMEDPEVFVDYLSNHGSFVGVIRAIAHNVPRGSIVVRSGIKALTDRL